MDERRGRDVRTVVLATSGCARLCLFRGAWTMAGSVILALTMQFAQAGALDQIQLTGTLRVCTTGDYPPYTSVQQDGGYEGIDIDVARRLGQALGAHVEFVKSKWADIVDDVAAGRCMIAMGGTSVTPERAKKVAFSETYYVDGKSAIVRCTELGRFRTLADIDRPGVRVIVNPGGSNQQFAQTQIHQATVSVHADNLTIFTTIVDGESDVMITDTSEIMLQRRRHPELCAANPGTPFVVVQKAYLLPRDDLELKDFVDQSVQILQVSGEFEEILRRWMY